MKSQVADDVSLVQADRRQLETVLLNLGTNARDAMPSGGTLTLTASREKVTATPALDLAPGDYVKLSVADTGTGMDAQTLARATESFFTTKPVGKGTGLGLSMARAFAKQSNGAFEITSEPGNGTMITLWLPQASPSAEARASAKSARAGTTRTAVLLVEDDPLLRQVLSEQLSETYDVVCASAGDKALREFRGIDCPDVLATDLTMPGMNGLATIREARARCPRLPAVLITSFTGDVDQLAAMEQVTTGFAILRKPVSAAMLVDQIEAELLAR